MSGHWDVGAALLIALPLAADRLRRVRLRNAFAVSVLAFLAGVVSLLGRGR